MTDINLGDISYASVAKFEHNSAQITFRSSLAKIIQKHPIILWFIIIFCIERRKQVFKDFIASDDEITININQSIELL